MIDTTTMIKPQQLIRLLVSVLLLLSVADGFGIQQPTSLQQTSQARPTNTAISSSTTPPPSTTLTPSNRYYQLEEMEDQETCTTEIYLVDDGSVQVSSTQTDGPLPSAAAGTWTGGDGTETSFRMTIARTFGTGVGMDDVGSFTVERSFRGAEVKLIGEAFSITGTMHSSDIIMGDIDVGYFSMIDTTDAKLGEDGEE